MSMNSPHESVKEIVGDVWKNNKPLAIAVLVVAMVVIYVLYKKSQSSLVASGATDTTPTTGLGNTYNNTYTTITKTVTGGQPAPTPAPSPSPAPGKSSTAIVRGKQKSGIDKLWDSSHSGVPVRAQPSGQASVVRIAPYGSMVPLLQASLTAAANQQGGSNQWYPVAGGYLSAWDVASIK